MRFEVRKRQKNDQLTSMREAPKDYPDRQKTFGQVSRAGFQVRKTINVPPKIPTIPPAGCAIENGDS